MKEWMCFTNISCLAFDYICRDGHLDRIFEDNNINFLPVHDLLQNMLISNPERCYSVQDILNHEWLREEGAEM